MQVKISKRTVCLAGNRELLTKLIRWLCRSKRACRPSRLQFPLYGNMENNQVLSARRNHHFWHDNQQIKKKRLMRNGKRRRSQVYMDKMLLVSRDLWTWRKHYYLHSVLHNVNAINPPSGSSWPPSPSLWGDISNGQLHTCQSCSLFRCIKTPDSVRDKENYCWLPTDHYFSPFNSVSCQDIPME